MVCSLPSHFLVLTIGCAVRNSARFTYGTLVSIHVTAGYNYSSLTCSQASPVAEVGVARQSQRGVHPAVANLLAQDVAIMQTMQPAPVAPGKPVRSEHKFQKKPQKHNGPNARVLARAGVSPYGGFDEHGQGLSAYVQVGRKGGIVR
jgi:hypothetical protein